MNCPVSIRFDRAPLSNTERLPDGRLRVRATFSRVGPLNYLRADGTIQQEIVTADELFREDSLETAGLAPVTLGHPPDGMVTPKTWKKYAVGASGSTVLANRVDGLVDVVFVIGDEEAIEAVESGRATEVSAGYSTLVEARGDGKLYQTNRQYNHLAIVERGRAGPGVRLHIDAAEDWAVMADEWDEDEDERIDADASPEDLVLLAARVVFEAGDWKILGLKNLEIEPGESLSFQVVVEQDVTGKRLLQQVEYNAITNEWVDSVIEGRTDVWRIDAPKKGSKRGKRTEAPKCKAGKKCGMTCINMERKCRNNPDGAVEEALKQAVGSGGGSGGGGTKVPPNVKSTADNLAASSTAIVKYEGGATSNNSTEKNSKKKYFTDGPDPGLKRVPTQELLNDLLRVFEADSVTTLEGSRRYQMATAGMELDLSKDSDIRVLYREWVRVPMDERNPPPGPATMNGINVMRTFRPWAAFDLDSKTATRDDLKRAYRKAVMGRHPDQGGDREIFEEIRKMYQSLEYSFDLKESMNPPKKGRSRKK